MNAKRGCASGWRTFGEYPPVLYRAFDSREYAEAFANEESVRLGLVAYYSEIEDAQRIDKTEGTGSIVAPGIVTRVAMTRDGVVTRQWDEPGHIHHSTTFGNAIYILSLSSRPAGDLSFLRHKFGPHIIQIDDPRQLGQDLTDALCEGPADTAGVIECLRVRYNKGSNISHELDSEERLRLSFGQNRRRSRLSTNIDSL